MTTAVGVVGRKAPRARIPIAVVLAIGVAWALAIAAFVTGRESTLHHHAPIEHGPPLWAAALLFVVAWQAMIAAMMLPSSLPLVRLFTATAARQERAWLVIVAFLGGYAAVWSAFGLIALFGDVVIHRSVDATPWLVTRPWLIAGGALLLAGAFQFTDLKDRCLSKCRQPGPFLLAHYRRGPGGGFELGLRHGVFCLGCCWALMLIMFAVGVAVLWWMAALTAVMVYEKTGRHGRQVAQIGGVVLLVWGATVLAQPRWLPNALALDTTGIAVSSGTSRVGPGPVRTLATTAGYRLELAITPNEHTRPNELVLRVTKRGAPVQGADVQTSVAMLAMDMGRQRSQLHERQPGVYGVRTSAFAMPGEWAVRVDLTTPSGRRLSHTLVDHVGD
jgi:predicted metal-binding membrane protein